jgi:hypothetical protein
VVLASCYPLIRTVQAALAIFNCPKELVVARVGTPRDEPDPPPCHYLNRYPVGRSIRPAAMQPVPAIRQAER